MNRVQRGTLVATGLGLFMIFLDALIVNVALPDIQADFEVGEEGLQWVVTAYSIGMAALMMTAATLADRWGRRRLYVGGLVVFVLASAGCGLAPSIEVLNVARGVQGLAAATVNVTSLALVSAAFDDPDQRARGIGIWTAVAASAIALGPTVGGLLTEWIDWRSVFFVNVPVGLMALALTKVFVDESRDSKVRSLDLFGQLLYVVSIGAFAWTIIQGPEAGWTSPSIVLAFVVFAVGLVGFVVWERRVDEPMMDLSLFTERAYTLAILAIFAGLFSAYGMLLVLTQFWQDVDGLSPVVTGLLIAPFALGQMVLAPRVGRWVARTGSRRLVILGLGVLVVGYVIEIVGVEVSGVLVTLGIGVVGVGLAFLMTPATSLAMSSVPEDRAGMASGIMSSQRAIGSTAGYAILGTVLAAWLGATLDDSLTDAIPDASERQAVTDAVVEEANPQAYAAEIGPGRPIPSASTATQDEIADAASDDFRRGIQVALAVGALVVVFVLIGSWFGFPHDRPAAAEP